jgi:hypothetical protein
MNREPTPLQLGLELCHVIAEGSRVDVLCSRGYRITGRLVGRFTYHDRSEGARVETDEGALIVVPLADLVPAGVTV